MCVGVFSLICLFILSVDNYAMMVPYRPVHQQHSTTTGDVSGLGPDIFVPCTQQRVLTLPGSCVEPMTDWFLNVVKPAQEYATQIREKKVTYAGFLAYLYTYTQHALGLGIEKNRVDEQVKRIKGELFRQYYLLFGEFLYISESNYYPEVRYFISELRRYGRFDRSVVEVHGEFELDLKKSLIASIDQELLMIPDVEKVTRLSIADNNLRIEDIDISVLQSLPCLKWIDMRLNNLKQEDIFTLSQVLQTIKPGIEVLF